MTCVQMRTSKSHCHPPDPDVLRQLREKYGARQGRFTRAARLTQIMYTLTACGPCSMRSLAQIIAGYTGEDPEIVRRILYRHLKLLTDLWLVEKRNKELRITPIGLYVVTKKVTDDYGYVLEPHVPFWIASRLEEWEKALHGLRIFLENAKLKWMTEYEGFCRPEQRRLLARREHPNVTEQEALFLLLNFNEIEGFGEDEPVMVLHKLSEAQLLATIRLYDIELSEREFRDTEYVTKLKELVKTLQECSYRKCPDKALELFLDYLIEGKGILSYLDVLDTELVKRMTGWPEGKPPLTSALAVVVAWHLVPIEVDSIITAVGESEGRMSEFLSTLLVVHALDILYAILSDLSVDLIVISKYKNSVIPRLWSVRDPRYRELASVILELNRVLNEHLEFSPKGGSG